MGVGVARHAIYRAVSVSNIRTKIVRLVHLACLNQNGYIAILVQARKDISRNDVSRESRHEKGFSWSGTARENVQGQDQGHFSKFR